MDGSQMTGVERVPLGTPATTARRKAPAMAAKSAALGFVAGALCWHLIGFWGFVNEAVFFRRGEPLVQSRMTGAPAKAQNRQSETAPPAVATNCVSGRLDRNGGDAVVGGCEGALKVGASRNIMRADRGDFGPVPVPVLISGEGAMEPAVAAWSARIETRGE